MTRRYPLSQAPPMKATSHGMPFYLYSQQSLAFLWQRTTTTLGGVFFPSRSGPTYNYMPPEISKKNRWAHDDCGLDTNESLPLPLPFICTTLSLHWIPSNPHVTSPTTTKCQIYAAYPDFYFKNKFPTLTYIRPCCVVDYRDEIVTTYSYNRNFFCIAIVGATSKWGPSS